MPRPEGDTGLAHSRTGRKTGRSEESTGQSEESTGPSGRGEAPGEAGTGAKSLGFILVPVGIAAGFLNKGMIWSNLSFKTGISKPTARRSPQPVFVNKNWRLGGCSQARPFLCFPWQLSPYSGGGG